MKIELKDVSFSYRSGFTAPKRVLSDISLSFLDGEKVAVVGSTGSGKTTLIQLLNGLLSPDTGWVRVDGEDLADRRTDISRIRQKVGLVFQFPENQLFEETVFQDVAYGPGNMGLAKEEIERRVYRSLELVGLYPKKMGPASPFHLSGGEKRRVAIAGILAMEPQVLVLDEPTVGLDNQGISCIETMMTTFHQQGRSIIFVSHDMNLVGRLADRVVVLVSGRVRYDGDKTSLFQNAGLLEEAGLEVPPITQVLYKLKDRGYELSLDIYDIEEAKKAIRRAVSSNKK
jgi:energy-coupling factor transport system ATP-binding protein